MFGQWQCWPAHKTMVANGFLYLDKDSNACENTIRNLERVRIVYAPILEARSSKSGIQVFAEMRGENQRTLLLSSTFDLNSLSTSTAALVAFN